MKTIYDEAWYRKGLRKREVFRDYAEQVYKVFDPCRIVDVGCGSALALEYFYEHGCDILGLEHSIEAATAVMPDYIAECVVEEDISHWLDGEWEYDKYDIALSWAVAEHVGKEFAEGIVEGLTRLSDTVHFSAAPPGQGGRGHINCQTPEWWEKIFKKHRYVLDPVSTLRWLHPLGKKYGDEKFGRCVRNCARIYRKK